MQKWIYSIVLSFLALLLIPPLAVSADAGGNLTAEDQKITVTLQKPQEEPEAVISLRCWLDISVLEGEISQPVFEFSEALLAGSTPGSVHSAAVSGQDGRYIVDIIVSEKIGRDIFAGGSQIAIGTLNLPASASGKPFRVYAAFTGTQAEDSCQPVLQYMSSTSLSVQTVPLSDVNPVICTDTQPVTEDPDASVTPEYPTSPGYPVTPGYPITPAVPDQPAGSDTLPDTPKAPDQDSDGSDTAQPEDDIAAAFKKKAAPQLKLSTKNESRRVSFQWSRMDEADGYQIYRYEEDTRRYTRIKTITNADKTAYSKAMEYGTAYAFRVRAFRTQADGSRIYGKFSPIVKAATAPAKVAKLSVKKLKSQKAVLIWQPAESADGYQIYRSTKKNGSYSRIKTIPNGESKKYSGISQTKGKRYYYKVRAYVAAADGKRIYGKFSSVKQLLVR